jgi:hypothetical protein
MSTRWAVTPSASSSADVAKIAEYLRSGLGTQVYVVIVEECDHGFRTGYACPPRTARCFAC